MKTPNVFRKMPDQSLTSVTAGEWGVVWAQQAVNLNPQNDDNQDLTIATYFHHGVAPTKVYTLLGNGDGTFADPVERFTHPQSKGPANSLLLPTLITMTSAISCSALMMAVILVLHGLSRPRKRRPCLDINSRSGPQPRKRIRNS